MLESDIKALYQRMAAADRPPTRVSIPSAHRSGRARLRRRRTRTIASPLLAAGAVLAIVFTGSLPAGRFGSTHAPSDSRPAAEGAFPRYFSPLRPYASLGWLPGGIMKHAGQTSLTSTSLTISFGNPPGELDAFSAGICHLTGHVLTCPKELGSGLPARQSLDRKVGLVNGHPAYWTSRGMRISAPLP